MIGHIFWELSRIGQWDGWVDKGAYYQALQPEFDLWDQHGRKR